RRGASSGSARTIGTSCARAWRGAGRSMREFASSPPWRRPPWDCLVHRQLAESLQLCLLDPESLREWYYARSPFLSPQRRAEILGSLYELDGVTFHLALRRADLDTAWPMFSETLAGGVEVEDVEVEVKDLEVDVEEDVEVEKGVEEEDEKEVEEEDDEDKDEGEVEDVEVDTEWDVEVDVEENVKEEDEEQLEEDEKEVVDVDVEELEDAHGAGKASQPDGYREPGTSPPPSTGCMLGSSPPMPRQPGGTEMALRVLVSQLRAELGQREAASHALAARLAQERRRHRRQEES
ncbi:PREDICTED: FYVE and coiled-coil domain-containing protein 1-like, partial [Chlamydotis macqueenii]|uniref:FYVE and coiled-coil domain-containing protein 1-like n=1 Tax=Chlamydotis macqueenii TaxID=187382 RepID=UPI000529F30F